MKKSKFTESQIFNMLKQAESGLSVRSHWEIEVLHWCLDVSFNEDDCRVRKGHAAENFSTIRRIALNLLKNENSRKVGIKTKRKKCGWSNQYLLKVLSTK